MPFVLRHCHLDGFAEKDRRKRRPSHGFCTEALGAALAVNQGIEELDLQHLACQVHHSFFAQLGECSFDT